MPQSPLAPVNDPIKLRALMEQQTIRMVSTSLETMGRLIFMSLIISLKVIS
jgi:uncharacterized ParB-like nuclease family protein